MAGSPLGGSPIIELTRFTDYRKLESLVPGADCDTRGGVITVWRDVRPQPTYNEIEAVLDATVEAEELEARALELSEAKKAFAAVLEITYENSPDLQSAYASVNLYKVAVKDRYKEKL